MKILVIGATGMLGSAVTEVLATDPEFDVTAAGRRAFDIESDLERVRELIRGHRWIVNAAGILKSRIDEHNAGDRARAITVNALFPHRLAEAAEAEGARVIQIATDGVFSGARGAYAEDDPHDAADLYGKTKSLGEVPSPAVVHLRCSIIGPEMKESRSLLEWLRRQPRSATLRGFTSHRWNGITTLHFARLAAGIMRGAVEPRRLQHIVPADSVTKAELLRVLARCYDRADLHIEDVESPDFSDRTLSTRFPDQNAALWRAAGYDQPPAIANMIEELARFTIHPRDTSG